MKLIWEHAETSSNPRWKGMTWGMIPSHASGLCACTYHLFYNSPELYPLVSIQAGLTVLGNAAMATAAYRIYSYEKDVIGTDTEKKDDQALMDSFMAGDNVLVPLEDDKAFWTNMALKSALIALIVKYGELFVDFPFDPTVPLALAFILGPTGVNVVKWGSRSSDQPALS
jgi:hypothetical protein